MKAIHWHDPRSMKEQEEKDSNKEEEENKEQTYEQIKEKTEDCNNQHRSDKKYILR